MDLILWRHAEADDGLDDLARNLTPKGEKQAARMAEWLRSRLPAETAIIASEALRARRTAAALSENVIIDPRLNPGAGPDNYLAVANWPFREGAVVLVGHQPTIGRMASILLAGIEADWTSRKGAIWWIQHRVREDRPQTVLRAMLSPEQL